MLVCPQCEFENPLENKFCQNCGISLTHKMCCECHQDIPIESEICSFCGATNHTLLWAIISQKHSPQKREPQMASISSEAEVSQPSLEIENLTDLFANDSVKTRPTLQLQGEDAQSEYHRYYLQQKMEAIAESWDRDSQEYSFVQGQVVDQYPLQKTFLATLQKQQMDLFAELSQDLNDSYLSVAQYWNLLGLPTHALPYLMLERYTPVIPRIYDAWQQQDQGVVLLPNRSQWPLLTELWSEPELTLMQVIWFLDEMAKLWNPLQKISCTRSLLVWENLRIDDDQALCLQQLYLDQEPTTHLKALGQIWSKCLQQSNLNGWERLNQLIDKIIAEEITEVETLRLELHNLGLEEVDLETDVLVTEDQVGIPSELEDMELEVALDNEPIDFFDELNEDMKYASELEDQATAMIPMQLREVCDSCCTDIGVQRDHNEDFFGVKTTISKSANNTEDNLSFRGLYIVCDGMGGHAAGEVASAMAVEHLQRYFQTHWLEDFPDQTTIEEGVLVTNETLYQTNLDNARSGSGRMGTTLVMALLQDTQLAIAHVGDSRIYRISRKRGLEQLTQDHEVGQREINRGVEPNIAYGRPDAYQLTQALGPRESDYVRPEVQFMDITEDCLFLLCSDGLSDNEFIEQHWSEYLEPLISSSNNLQDGLFELVNLANQHNGHDNITAVVLRVKLKPDF